MRKRVHKYQIALAPIQTVVLPRSAAILHIAAQGDTTQLWALINPLEEHIEEVEVLIAGTGVSDVEDEKWEHFQTFFDHQGKYVWHVFLPKADRHAKSFLPVEEGKAP